MQAVLGDAPAGSDLKVVRGPGTNGLVQVLRLRRNIFDEAAGLRAEFGDLALLKAFGIKIVYAQGPEAADVILANRDRAYASGPAWEYLIGPFFRRGLMLLDFDEHHEHKRIMQQAFTPANLKGYMDVMMPGIRERIAGWSVSDNAQMYGRFKELTLDLALDVFVGMQLTESEAAKINRAFIDAVRAGSALIRKPVPGLRWQKGLTARKVLEDFFYSKIGEKRRQGGSDLFAVMCSVETEEGMRFSDEDVVNHMIFLLMAAHDTSTTTMTTMAYYLAKNPEWQDRVRQQSQQLGDDLAYDRLDDLTGLDWCMKESLRLCAPVPGIPRRAVRDTELLGHHIPANTTVVISTLTNHYIPEYWPEPTAFDPERFSPERREDKIHRLAWEPFGGGVHRCIGLHFAGMQIKAIYHELLQRYQWNVPSTYEWPLDVSALPVPRDGLPVTLTRIPSMNR
ncbi:MAG: cytochrome P450 [Mycobacteriaceae bacterium]